MSVSGLVGSPKGGGTVWWNSKEIPVFFLGSGGDFKTDQDVAKKITKNHINNGTLNIELDFDRFSNYMFKTKKNVNKLKLHASLSTKGALSINAVRPGIIDFLEENSGKDMVFYYTGHGITKKGNWCFYNGTITYEWFYAQWRKYDKGKNKIYVISDCCYSGIWTKKAYLSSDEHKGRFMVQSACGPDRLATDNVLTSYLFCSKPRYNDPLNNGAGCNVRTGGYLSKNKKWVKTYKVINGCIQFM
eukprot:512911_1